MFLIAFNTIEFLFLFLTSVNRSWIKKKTYIRETIKEITSHTIRLKVPLDFLLNEIEWRYPENYNCLSVTNKNTKGATMWKISCVQVSSIGDISLSEMFLLLRSIFINGLHVKCLHFTTRTRVTQILLLHCKRLETVMDKWIAYVKCIV